MIEGNYRMEGNIKEIYNFLKLLHVNDSLFNFLNKFSYTI